MASTRKYVPGQTGVGTAVFPKITKPDTTGKFADGKHKTGFAPDDAAETAALKKKLRDFAAECGIENPKLPIKTDKKDGTVSFNFKTSKGRPVVFDSQGNKIPPNKVPDIFGGAKLRIAYTMTNYDEGVSLWLDGVKLLSNPSRTVAFTTDDTGDFVFDPDAEVDGDEDDGPDMGGDESGETPAADGKSKYDL
jgi:hypothetical protein